MTELPDVHTQADLLAVWRRLMTPLGFRSASLWMLHLDADGRASPAIAEIAELPELPDEVSGSGFLEVLRHLDADHPGGRFAFLRSRPGHGIEAADREWAAFIYAAGRSGGVRMEVVHLATDVDVVPLPMDEVGVRRTA